MENPDLLLSNYNFDLPQDRIAHRPCKIRSESKLLVYNKSTDTVSHHKFSDIEHLLPKDSLLVLNESKVFPCRLIGNKKTGAKCEVFLLSLLHKDEVYPAMIKTSGKKNVTDEYFFDDLVATITGKNEDGSFLVKFNVSSDELLDKLEKIGNIPIPPYIRGGVADEQDIERYQTVYAGTNGSVAAPTAGLHFTNELFEKLESNGIKKAFVTLHVSAGTFKPVSVDNILDHSMHSESFFITDENLKKINANKKRFAVGTTSLRVLESCTDKDSHIHFEGDIKDTDIFLYPGKDVYSIDGLITNFHLPKSTLLMLVSSLVGREKTLELYDIAIKNDYRFFSYGDSMLIIR
ncbi:MAG: tRNA preQ1(34) S-adenosylmethionine ribosyltransferase-isomerase QueA [Bacteriovoracaceae bacterium]|jgi:S-adenosylmethionine:tRNA ribosyltransferase-isomerase|nr:tRNA preQ1(34) S-adenosylmethionine ribosyltransferase-isomerase QueA [Bacteriovoracaceae bacterium]